MGRSISINISLCYLVCFHSRWGLIVRRRAGLLNYNALMSVVKYMLLSCRVSEVEDVEEPV